LPPEFSGSPRTGGEVALIKRIALGWKKRPAQRSFGYGFVAFSLILLIAYSAKAVMVRLGLTPGLAGITEPSTTYKPG
jgi:hypothetical protein